jgi:tryptophan halogenase
MKNIVIVGGGTAGWITALMIQRYHPYFYITVVESEEIGILGAGEGTVPHFITILDTIGISFADIVKYAGGTVKNGIRFVNWNGDNKDYFHGFNPIKGLGILDDIELIQHHLFNANNFDNVNLGNLCSKDQKVPFSYKNIQGYSASLNPIEYFQNYQNWAIHFNARELAVFLRRVAESRGIQRLEGKVIEIVSAENGKVSSLKTDNDQIIPLDFVFDCSGFARLLIGKHFKTDWVSYSQHLPMDTAVPFFIDHDNNVEPETKAIAMKYGWIWQIPVQDRYGCGYVFDSSYIDEEQALNEAEELFGQNLTSPKTFKFDPGTYDKTLVKNCLAIGLAQSFVEPLEATSLWISFLNLTDFLDSKGLLIDTEHLENSFNQRCNKRNSEVLDFIFFHYLTKRSDSNFWKEFLEKNKPTISILEIIELLKHNPLANLDKNNFLNSAYLQVGFGLEIFTDSQYQNIKQLIDLEIINDAYKQCRFNLDNVIKSCVSHKEFLSVLKSIS